MTTSIATVNLGKKHRYGQMDKLLYLTDGLHQPKMYDGDSLVNWGITAPSAKTTIAASSSGSNVLDTCELPWTPASLLVHDGESAFSLVSGITNATCSISPEAKVGTKSSLLLLGYGAEPITAATMLMLHMDGVDGSQTFVDSSESARVVTRHLNGDYGGGTGFLELDSAQKKFGTTSLLSSKGAMAYNYNYISVPASTDWETNVYTDSYTVEFWVRFSSFNYYGNCLIFRQGTLSLYYYGSGVSHQFMVYMGAANLLVMTRTEFLLLPDNWYHIRLCVQTGLAFLFVNGVRAGLPAAIPLGVVTGPNAYDLHIGATGGSGANGPDAWIDEFRWDKGICMSTEDFVPPTMAYGTWVPPTGVPTGITGMVAYKNFTPLDLSGYYGIQFWMRSMVPLSAGDVSILICDSSGGVDTLETIQCPVMPAYSWVQISHQFVLPTLLTSVASIAISINRDLGENGIYIDDVRAIRCLVSIDSTHYTQGGASVRLDIAGNTPDGVLLAYNNLTSVDMHSDTIIMASIRPSKTLGTAQFQYLLDDTLGCTSPLEAIYLPDLLEGEIFNDVQLAIATPAALTAVMSHGLRLANKSAVPCSLWIDNVRRAVSTSGNLTGRYFVWVAFYSSKYDRESDLSPISSVCDCQGQAISLTGIPVATDPQVNMRRIYRSAAGGTVPYLDSTIGDNTTTTLTLNKSDATILASARHPSLMAGSGKLQPPPAAPYVVQQKNRFIMAGSIRYDRGTVTATNGSATMTFTSAQLDDSFVGRFIQIIGDTTNYVIESVNSIAKTCVVRPLSDLVSGTYVGVTGAGKAYYIYSDSENTVFTSYVDDDDTPRPHGFPIEFAQDIIEGTESDVVSGLGFVGDSILVTKFFSTHLMEGNYPPFAVSRISSVIGCISHDTIASDGTGLTLWLSGIKGIASCNGSTVTIISDKIKDIFSGGHALSLNPARFADAHAVYDVTTNAFYLFCSSELSDINDVCIVLDKSNPNPDLWGWYYFTGVEAACSTIINNSDGSSSIYIGDYDGFYYELNVGWYDGISSGTLSGTATSAAASVLNDIFAAFYTTGSGLRNINLLINKISTGETWTYKILSNTGTSITIDGVFTEIPNTADYKYYIGGYEIDWKSKQFELLRPTDKKLLMDAVVNHYSLAVPQTIRFQVLKNLGATQIANQLRDLSANEEQVLLVRERVSQAQWRVSGFVHGQNVQIVSLGLRLKARGIR